jgi:hypothetical protein
VERTYTGSLRNSSAPPQGRSRPERHRSAAGSLPHACHGFIDNAGDRIIGDDVAYLAGCVRAVGRYRSGEVLSNGRAATLNCRAAAHNGVFWSEVGPAFQL